MARKDQPPPKNFEEALRELEQIISQIESGQISLEESLAKYERGSFLIQHCTSVLNEAEKKIELISKGPNGSLQSSPLPEEQPSSK